MRWLRRSSNRAGPFDYSRKWSLRSAFLLGTVFLYAPIIVLIVFSFNDSRRGGNILWKGFTTKYYGRAFANDELMLAFGNSITIAVVSTIISVILGALTAVVLWRFRFPLKPLYEGLVALPIVIPLLPHMKPGLIASALLAFTLSLDDFVITFFTSGPNTVTFPVKIYSMVRFSVTPEINAASTILILITLVLTFIALRYQRVDT